MSDMTDSIKEYLYGKKRKNQVDDMHKMEMQKGKRAKSVLDKQQKNQNYKRTQTVQAELLNHYENVDWYERNYQFDFSSYMEK